ncbi:MAG: exodeoxyribonuclease III [Proteobacteria bacterium]|nr:exodeoxyribonuclease III [Pseudomonadota bacterium]
MKFVSWNVNGLRAAVRNGFLDVVKGMGADLFALQEIKARPDQLGEEVLDISGYKSHWNPAEKAGYSGVAVYAREEPLEVRRGMGQAEFDAEGRVLSLSYPDFWFVNAYFPNAQDQLRRLDFKIAFDEAFQEYVEGLAREKTTVVCGDLNVAHNPIDLANPKRNEKNAGYSPQERAWMDRFLSTGWVDTFRMFYPDLAEQYSWWSYRFKAREKNIGWRIDYFAVDEKSRGRVKSAGIEAGVTGSDHCPVTLEMD